MLRLRDQGSAAEINPPPGVLCERCRPTSACLSPPKPKDHDQGAAKRHAFRTADIHSGSARPLHNIHEVSQNRRKVGTGRQWDAH